MAPPAKVATKKGDPKAQAVKATKAVKSGALTLKRKIKKIRTSVTFRTGNMRLQSFSWTKLTVLDQLVWNVELKHPMLIQEIWISRNSATWVEWEAWEEWAVWVEWAAWTWPA
ncbi:uncharacterized protein LOC113336097 isoform X2 [Papaver somniferum]|uniref:uncharacterized protein LOC113336097 isoform X2 n=1 Tax=Papaver somniferum TaxID=3469 RepID=UPI000E704D07|nr:uncharacterized protein LOC113336097 isoform X2 [Papaver somniferum]